MIVFSRRDAEYRRVVLRSLRLCEIDGSFFKTKSRTTIVPKGRKITGRYGERSSECLQKNNHTIIKVL